jgi:hypothetical protein
MFRLITAIFLALASSTAIAYVGPGAGISVLGSLLGILATIVLAIGAIIMWPLRKALKKRKAKAADAVTDSEAAPPTDQT